MKRAPLTYRRRCGSQEQRVRLQNIERRFHVRVFGEELAKVNLDFSIEERLRYLDWMRELAQKQAAPAQVSSVHEGAKSQHRP